MGGNFLESNSPGSWAVLDQRWLLTGCELLAAAAIQYERHYILVGGVNINFICYFESSAISLKIQRHEKIRFARVFEFG
jgi:hypothetical protein